MMIVMNTRDMFQGYFVFDAMAKQLVEMGGGVGARVFSNMADQLIDMAIESAAYEAWLEKQADFYKDQQ